MSLNGLDAQPLTEAFETAQNEPGGWFWIKYATRDDIELLLRGSNGAEEMREVAAKEPDDSPLYGFIRFRRRNLLIKYVPEETSRVLKARSQVHFQLVIDRFSPHDSTCSISSIEQLTESGLTAASSTHSVSASVSSSNSSLRQRRLEDIAESADEEEPPTPQASTISKGPASFTLGETDDKGKNHGQGLAVVVTTHDSNVSDAGPQDGADRDVSSLPLRGDQPPRRSTSSLRPSTDLSYLYTPKVKLGPRPHVETPKRPHTSSERSKNFQTSEELRASVPRSVHLPPRRSSITPNLRSKSVSSISTTSIPELFIPQPPSPSAPTSPSPVSDAPPALTPEKQRLMRALQLRRQTILMGQKKEQDRTDDTASINNSTIEDMNHVNTPEKEPGMVEVEHEAGEPDEDHNEPVQEEAAEESNPQSVHPTEESAAITTQAMDECLVDKDKPIIETVDPPSMPVVVEVKPEETKEVKQDSEKVVENEDTPSTPVSLTDKEEGLKVRDDVSSEGDATSVKSLDVNSSAPPMTFPSQPAAAQVSDIPKSIYRAAPPEKPSSPEQKPPSPKVLKRFQRQDTIPPNETPVIETARSVSAPFLQTARDTKPVVARKVNVSSGSVSQRIKQFQMMATSKESLSPATVTRSPSVSRSNSPTPDFLNRSPSVSTPSTPAKPMPMRQATSPAALPPPNESAPSSPPKVVSPPPKMEIIEKDNKPQLQVTTTINREETKADMSPKDDTQTEILPPKREPSPTSASSRRKSLDASSAVDHPSQKSSESLSNGRKSSVEKERPSFFSRPSGSKDADETPTSSFGSRRGSASSASKERSPKSPSSKGSGLLKRMGSSFSRKKDAPESKPVEQPAKPVLYKLAGWVNVQLPDTMLWRRRCMKVDSDGVLFLSVSEDETAPQTRRYHLPSEVRKVDLPDLDEQELPNSVRLYLNEGGMLQCACQNRGEQEEIIGAIRSFLNP